MDPRPYHYEYRKPRLSNPTFQSGHLYESIYHLGSYGKMNPNIDKINNNFVASNYQDIKNKYSLENNKYTQLIPVTNQIPNHKGQRYRENDLNNDERKHYTSINNYESDRYSHEGLPDRKKSDYIRYKEQQYASNNYPPQGKQPYLQIQNNDKQRQGQNSRQSNGNRSPNYSPYHQEQSPYHQEPLKQNQGYEIQAQKQFSQPRSYSQDTRSSNQKQAEGYMRDYGTRLMRAMPGKDQDYIYERQQKAYNIITCYPKDSPSITHRIYPKYTLENKLIERGQFSTKNNNNPQRY